MSSLKSFQLQARLLVAFNVLVGLGLLFLLVRGSPSGSAYQSPTLTRIEDLLAQKTQAASGLLTSRLEETEEDLRIVAEFGTHVFSHPESFRLAAQPGEYDYDKASGIYGSLKNDGSSVLLLSARTPLNPEVLHDIRLTEYLNPVFKSVCALKSDYRSISLYTTDSLMRSFPWFDIGQKLAEHTLKPDFNVAELPMFAQASPDRNPQRKPVWGLRPASDGIGAVCALPVFAGENFKGVAALELNLAAAGKQALKPFGSSGEVFLLLDEKNSVVGLARFPEAKAAPEMPIALPVAVGNLELPNAPGIEALLRRIAPAGGQVEWSDRWAMQVTPLEFLSVRLVVLQPSSMPASASPLSQMPGKQQQMIYAIGALAFLLLLNSCWVYWTHRKVCRSAHQLSLAFSALARLDLDSSWMSHPEGAWSDLMQKFNQSVGSLKAAFQALPLEEGRHSMSVAEVDGAVAEMEILSQRARILASFSAEDTIEDGFSKLNSAVCEIFSVEKAVFLFYSAEDNTLHNRVPGCRIAAELPEGFVVTISEEGLLGSAWKTRQPVYANSLDSSEQSFNGMPGIGKRNALAGPLFDQQKMLGLVVLTDKDSDFGAHDQHRLQVLLEPLSKVMANLLQVEGYRQIDGLRRVYCQELIKAVEGPLLRIKNEVQGIFSRLGKLTPYYKEHCESILFEVGRLYEIAHEANTLDEISSKPRSVD